MFTPELKSFFSQDSISSAKAHEIAYTAWGDPENPKTIICVHGLTRNSRDFDYLAERLSRSARVYCLDMAGRGRSAYLEDHMHYHYGTYIQDCLQFMAHEHITSCDWVGTSMGGLIGMMLAASQPQLIDRMVINDIGPGIPLAALERIVKYVSVYPRFDTLQDVEAQLRVKLAPFGINHPSHWNHMVEHSVMRGVDGKYRFSYDLAIVDYFKASLAEANGKDVDLWDVYKAITCPLLILRGEKSDTLTPETALHMQTIHPDATLVTFPGVGHAPALMAADQIRAVLEWLGC